jgi:hypothetical protein
MGKHDVRSHKLHISKQQKFQQPKPNAIINIHTDSPQKPKPGTSQFNQFR